MLAGCSSATTIPASYTVTDMAGRQVTFTSLVNNVVTLYGPGYEKVAMLGAEKNIVACGDFNKTHAAWAHVITTGLKQSPR